MSTTKLLHRCAGVAAFLLVAVVAYTFWSLQRPSSAERRFLAVVAARAPVSAAENAFPLLWAFDAPVGVDTLKAGNERLAWIRRVYVDDPPPDRSNGDDAKEQKEDQDPHESVGEVKALHSPPIRQVVLACTTNQPLDCRDQFDAFPVPARWTELDSELLARYDVLLRHRGYQATVPARLRAPIPPWPAILGAQRLYFLRMLASARAGDAAAVRAGLAADLAFWRMMTEASDTLITKMLALACIRQHFFYANLVLRHLPPERVAAALPEVWRRPVDKQELSMWLVLAGEVEFMRALTRDEARSADEMEQTLADTGETFGERAMRRLRNEVMPLGLMLRRLAAAHARTAESFEVPLDRYLAVKQELEKQSHGFGNTSDYCVRTAYVEVWRRAALLAAELHAARVPAARAAAAVESSLLRDPLTGKPFEWHDDVDAIVVTLAIYKTGNNRELFFFRRSKD